MADPRRRAILEYLKNQGATAGEIAGRFEVSWPAISRHLRILRTAGLIWETRDGRSRYYEVNLSALAMTTDWFGQFSASPIRAPGWPAPSAGVVGREYIS